jgi:nucleoside-diphosphate-sugar epimerase
MLVTVTGGTGFVGSHSIAAIMAAGHQVRMLVRDKSTVDKALAGSVEVVAGDVTDERSVARAVADADAVLHAAAVYSFDSRMSAVMRQTNERAADVVLHAAAKAGADPIVHVSSVAALYPAGSAVVGATSPVGTAREPYFASKAAAEQVARRLQHDGAPVVITYPPALLGPDDPKLGDQDARVRNVLRGLMPVWPAGGFPIGDVRDTATLHAALLGGPRTGPGRYFGPGRYVSTKDYMRLLRDVTQRRLPAVFLPARTILPLGMLTAAVQKVWPWHIPAEFGAVYTCAHARPVDEAADTLGVLPRPLHETMADTVRWLSDSGLVSARQAGAARESRSRGTKDVVS